MKQLKGYARAGKVSIAPIIVLIIIIAGVGAVIYGGGLFYTKKISQIKADPTGWEEETVYLKGTVTDTISIWGFHGFVLNDGTGEIYVDWSGVLPVIGSKVIVHGVVQTFWGAAYITALDVRTAWF